MNETQSVALEVEAYALGAFIGYLLLIISIGIASSRFSSKGLNEFFLGGRKLNRWVVALSAVVSGRSAWLLLGLTGMAYVQGLSALWAAVGYIVVEFFLFLYYAPRIRELSEKYDCITIPDVFVARLGDKGHWLRITLVVVILIFMVAYVSAQFVAGGKAFQSSFNVDLTWGMAWTATIVLAYTILGGFVAVSITDVLQAIVMILALLAIPVLTFFDEGSWNALVQQVHNYDPSFLDPMSLTMGALLGLVGIGLGSPGSPHILVRYMSIDDVKQLRFTAYLGTFWNIMMALGAIAIGLVGRSFFPEVDMLPAADSENLFPALAEAQLHPMLFGIVVAAIFAAIMSTADSQLLVATSAAVRDIYHQILKKEVEIPQKTLVILSRGLVLVLVIAAFLFGLFAQDLVFWLVLFAWAGLGAALGPTSILLLFWKRTTWQGALTGVLMGTVTVLIWYNIPALKNWLYELIPAFIVSFVATVAVSLMTKSHSSSNKTFPPNH